MGTGSWTQSDHLHQLLRASQRQFCSEQIISSWWWSVVSEHQSSSPFA
jgi:hypothetical protein